MVLSRDPRHYQELIAGLANLQGSRCAYCEAPLEQERRRPHVDHFRQRRVAKHLTFDWWNLFWSCSNADCCAKHKDDPRSSYRAELILKPDLDDPRRFLQFGDDGSVSSRSDLSFHDQERAEVTIEAFNLNEEGLRLRRQNFVRAAIQAVEEVLASLGPDEAAAYLLLERPQFEEWPFSSAALEFLDLKS